MVANLANKRSQTCEEMNSQAIDEGAAQMEFHCE
jgi:hypothetical protein